MQDCRDDFPAAQGLTVAGSCSARFAIKARCGLCRGLLCVVVPGGEKIFSLQSSLCKTG